MRFEIGKGCHKFKSVKKLRSIDRNILLVFLLSLSTFWSNGGGLRV